MGTSSTVVVDAVDEAALDRAVGDVAAGAAGWAATPLGERAALLRRTHAAVAESAEEWVDAASAIKGLDPGSPLRGEEWLSGPYAVLTTLARLARTLDDLAEGRSPLHDLRFHDAPGGRRAVDVLPLDAVETTADAVHAAGPPGTWHLRIGDREAASTDGAAHIPRS